MGRLTSYRQHEVIMWLIVFIAGCSVPLIILACVYLWREKQWEKHNEPKTA